jgi:formylglycine-generating enzyme required for sulfatase activity
MITIRGGVFIMGCIPERDGKCGNDELPTRQVTLDSYQLSKFEVTQQLYEEVMQANPSHFSGCPTCPVESVSWDVALLFIQKLNTLTGKQYRLPTEAEWEFAARSGLKTKGFEYSGGEKVDEVAWYIANSDGRTHPVGTRKPNMLGFYDLSGNVWEWCNDWYDIDYSKRKSVNPPGPEEGETRVLRSGSWYGKEKYIRISNRGHFFPNLNADIIGFRLAHSLGK